MSDPISLAALEYGRRVLLRRIIRLCAWLTPLLLLAGFTTTLYGSLLLTSAGAADDTMTPAACVGLTQPVTDTAPPATSPTGMDAEQLANAATIAAVARRLHVPTRGIVVALATALQESTLHNIPYGDRDSIGLFQQRDPWGSRADRLNPAIAAEMFFTGGHGGQPGLMSIPGWAELPVTVAAQTVQRSAFPDAYATWEPLATQLAGAPSIADATCGTGKAGASSSAIVDAAKKWLGTPYSWGGGGLNGPTYGIGVGASTLGFDCSGLTRYAIYQATGRVLPRVATDQARALTPVPINQIQAGDLLFFHAPEDPPGEYHHVGIADGNGGMIHAPSTGGHVEAVPSIQTNSYFAPQLVLAAR